MHPLLEVARGHVAPGGAAVEPYVILVKLWNRVCARVWEEGSGRESARARECECEPESVSDCGMRWDVPVITLPLALAHKRSELWITRWYTP